MDHSLPLITTLVGGFVLAYVLGMLAHRLKISPMVGYLAAGVISGPFTPGYVADMALVPELAELVGDGVAHGVVTCAANSLTRVWAKWSPAECVSRP
mgnify:CR=1 FL=1